MPFCITKLRTCTILRDKARDCLKKAVQTYEEGEKLLSIL